MKSLFNFNKEEKEVLKTFFSVLVCIYIIAYFLIRVYVGS